MMRSSYEDIQAGGGPARQAPVERSTDQMTLAGVAVENAAGDEIMERLCEAHRTGKFLRLAFLNAHCVNVARRDKVYRRALEQCVVLPDGLGIDLGAQLLHGRMFVENLNGTDFVPRFFKRAMMPLKVGLVGGVPGVAEKAAEALGALAPRHKFIAVSDGYFGEAGRADLLTRLEVKRFDVVLVAMGVPAQERFMTEHLDARHGGILVGVGALFDFLAGNVPRAPLAIRRLRLEWIWRLTLEPSRLWRRYILGNPIFLADILHERLARRAAH
ncbi:putative N-acetyl-mannosamine transferase [Fulvimarina pelagi HTCC2506]|uniref:Putative N-acetyl-mannosamine transferase n=1 Tax=Fulvimarina pelagi HTCC2506 TaxID=314231 RepID=Q0G545_9HYPH|nr:WecB/TagA/CpsF family glycosyltransferase [Fulvimarina pelagi]EAU43219.1 putative N-acetyl-mannosamine transferase [Fulvimarina pelagi HTCC2506]